MSIEIYIWRGEMPNQTVWNGILRKKTVGHASMKIISEVNSSCTYISHRPKNSSSIQSERDDSKIYLFEDYYEAASIISFEEECNNRGLPHESIRILGLDEDRIEEYYQKYLIGELDDRGKYHVIKNNCCSVVVFFLRVGLICPKSSCNKCNPSENIPDKHLGETKNRMPAVFVALKDTLVGAVLLKLYFVYTHNQEAITYLLSRTGMTLLASLFILRSAARPTYKLLFNVEYNTAIRSPLFGVFNLLMFKGNLDSNPSNEFWSPISLGFFANRLKNRKEIKCYADFKTIGDNGLTANSTLKALDNEISI
jgi:hypothetical protein